MNAIPPDAFPPSTARLIAEHRAATDTGLADMLQWQVFCVPVLTDEDGRLDEFTDVKELMSRGVEVGPAMKADKVNRRCTASGKIQDLAWDAYLAAELRSSADVEQWLAYGLEHANRDADQPGADIQAFVLRDIARSLAAKLTEQLTR